MNIKPLASCGGREGQIRAGRQIRADYTGARPKSNAAAIGPQDRPKALFLALFARLSCGAKGACAKGRVTDQGPDSMDAKTPAGADDLSHTLQRIAEALERLSPRVPAAPDLAAADAFVWHPDGRRLMPVPKVNRVEMALLRGVDRVRDLLMDNTERFARGLPANNALRWA